MLFQDDIYNNVTRKPDDVPLPNKLVVANKWIYFNPGNKIELVMIMNKIINTYFTIVKWSACEYQEGI